METRLIQKEDNPVLAKIIRDCLEEFGANKPGTVYFDEATDRLSDIFIIPNSIYFVALSEDKIIGGAGIFPTEGLPSDTCELVKMYLIPDARGKGYGRILIDKCLDFARQSGYKKIYLETLGELASAVQIYKKLGFESLKEPLGNTGHFACEIRMIKDL